MCGFREWRSVRAAVSVLGPFVVLTVSALDAGGDGSSAITPSVKCSLLGLIMIDGSIPGMAGVFWRRTFWNAEIRDRKAGWWPRGKHRKWVGRFFDDLGWYADGDKTGDGD